MPKQFVAILSTAFGMLAAAKGATVGGDLVWGSSGVWGDRAAGSGRVIWGDSSVRHQESGTVGRPASTASVETAEDATAATVRAIMSAPAGGTFRPLEAGGAGGRRTGR